MNTNDETSEDSKEAPAPRRSELPNSLATRIVPLVALGVLFLAGIVRLAGPRVGQNFNGVVVVDFPRYEFYPDVKGCPSQGTPYWLVRNDDLNQRMTVRFDDLNHLFHGTWRVKFRGNLSRVGRFGYMDEYWREVHVVDVYQMTELDCGGSK